MKLNLLILALFIAAISVWTYFFSQLDTEPVEAKPHTGTTQLTTHYNAIQSTVSVQELQPTKGVQ